MSVHMTVAVAVENSAYSFDKAYDYLLRDNMKDVRPGCRVMVPFGRGNNGRQGIVIRIGETDNPSKLKYVSQVIDEKPILDDEMISLMLWLKERTFCTLFEAGKCILPAGLSHRTVTTYMAVPDVDLSDCDSEEKQLYSLASESKDYIDSSKLLKKAGISLDSDILDKMAKKGLLVRNFDSIRKSQDITIRMVRICESGVESLESNEKLTKKQKEILEVLTDIGVASVKEVCYFTGFTPAVINALEKKGLVELYDNEIYRNPYENIDNGFKKEIVLNDEQQNAYNNILNLYNEGNGGVSLLFGVTGSGKTQVYIKLIDSMLDQDKQVIVMVPEISLTPQTLNIFHARYGKDIAVFHSALSAGQRTDEWKRVKNGEVKIVIGTRSAVFAPLNNIGMIIIDEEQEHTYKSEQTPRYNAKDVARFRCAYHKAVLVLASATPSVETYANAVNGRFQLNTLSKRYSQSILPEVKIVDMYTDALSKSSYFSQELADKLHNNLVNHKQSILLINRRGYNTFASCKACGYVFTCPSCSISMTYHHANNRLMCHYCGYSQPFSDVCPECGSKDVRYSGVGTQKIEDELAALFPEARILRMDADSTMSKNSHERMLDAFSKGEYDIMLGTQMVAKGLDFENVTLVGVINADQQLNNDDFRSQERTFGLLTQVVGRAGRGKYKGTAVIQTYDPENEVLSIAAEQDYKRFFDEEITVRKMLIYPPYCDLCLCGFVGTNEAKVKAASEKFFDIIKEKLKLNYKEQKIIALGPMTARISKISNKFRYRLILKCKNTKEFRNMIGECICSFSAIHSFSDVSVYIDINPENII